VQHSVLPAAQAFVLPQDECSPRRPVGNKNVVVAKQRQGEGEATIVLAPLLLLL